MPQVKAVTHLSTHTPQIKAVYTRNSLWSTCLHTHITTAFDPHVYTHTLQQPLTHMFTHTKTTHYNLVTHTHHKPLIHLFTQAQTTHYNLCPPVHTHHSQWSTCSHTSQSVIHQFTHITASDPCVHTHHSQWSTCSHTYTHTQQPVTITSSHITPHYKLPMCSHTHTSSTQKHVTHMFTHTHTPVIHLFTLTNHTIPPVALHAISRLTES